MWTHVGVTEYLPTFLSSWSRPNRCYVDKVYTFVFHLVHLFIQAFDRSTGIPATCVLTRPTYRCVLQIYSDDPRPFHSFFSVFLLFVIFHYSYFLVIGPLPADNIFSLEVESNLTF